MRWDEQGAASGGRHSVIPRTLCFITAGGDLLLLRGAPTKRLWAGWLNGLGGHIEPGETPIASARREIYEESGLDVPDLALRGILHISSSAAAEGILIFVYVGGASSHDVSPGVEGQLEWHPLRALPIVELVEDLPSLIPRLFATQVGEIVYGSYTPDACGEMRFQFGE